MWVEKRDKDNYKFVEQYKDPLTGKNKRVSLTLEKNTAHTRKQAQASLEEKIRQRLQRIKDGTLKHGITLKQLSEEWLKIIVPQLNTIPMTMQKVELIKQ